MKKLYCITCKKYTEHKKDICVICETEYDHSKKVYIIAGDPNSFEYIQSKTDFLKKNPDAILIHESIALEHTLGSRPESDYLLTMPKDDIMKHTEKFKYSHLSKKEKEAKIEPVRSTPKINRNESCPCGSGKKYKKCCYDKTPHA